MKHYDKRKNKALVVGFVLLVCLYAVITPMGTFCANNNIYSLAEDLNKTVVSELDQIDFSLFDEVIDEFNENNINIFSVNSVKNKVYAIISGEMAVNYESVISGIFGELIELVAKYIPILSLIVGIGVLSNLLNGIKSNFNEKSTSNLIELVCFLSVVVLVVGVITSLITKTGGAIETMVKQMNVIFPIMLTLMVALGATASSSTFQPIVAIVSTYMADFFKFYILPLFLITFVMSIISNLSTSVKLDKFCSFTMSLFKWSVGLTFTLFFAIFSIQGITAGSFDSISIRTTKYTIKSYIPIVGGYLSDGMDLILASTLLIKNSIGLVGILIVISTVLSPLLDIVVFGLLLKLVSAILQPMGNNQVTEFLSSTSKTLTILSTTVIVVGFMYLISIGLIMTSSNMVV